MVTGITRKGQCGVTMRLLLNSAIYKLELPMIFRKLKVYHWIEGNKNVQSGIIMEDVNVALARRWQEAEERRALFEWRWTLDVTVGFDFIYQQRPRWGDE